MPAEATVKTALVTGGTAGIGWEIARGLAARGVAVMVVGRDAAKGVRAAADFGGVSFQADLALLRENRRLALEVARQVNRLDYLVLCAGIVQGRRIETDEGIESNFAVNYLGRFALTQLLLPLLAQAGRPERRSRIVTIGGAASGGKIFWDDINLTRRFGILTVVPQFCQANDLFVIEQARRLQREGLGEQVTVTTLKVGAVRTSIRRTFPWWMKVLVPIAIDPWLSQTPGRIADSTLRLLLSPEFEGKTGALFRHIRRFREVSPSALTASPEEGARLWALSQLLSLNGGEDFTRGDSCPF